MAILNKIVTINGVKTSIPTEIDGIVTLEGVIDIFNSSSIRNLDSRIIREIYNIFVDKGFGYQDAWEVVTGASKMKVMCKKDQAKVSIDILELLKKLKNDYNFELFQLMGQVDSKFKEFVKVDLLLTKKATNMPKEKFKEERRKALQGVDRLIKQAWKTVKNTNDDVDASLETFTKEELETLYELACIYDAVVRHTPNKVWVDAEGNEHSRVADYIFADKFLSLSEEHINDLINRKKEKLNTAKLSTRIKSLLDAMMNDKNLFGEEESFSKEEIAKLLINAPYILKNVTEAKFEATREYLTNYVEAVARLAEGTKFEERIKSISVKSMILKSSSVLTTSVYRSSKFLLGETIAKIESDYQNLDETKRISKKSRKAVIDFPNMHITNISVEDHYRIMQSQVNLFRSIDFVKLNEITVNLMNLFITIYHPDIDLRQLTLQQKKKLLTEDGISYDEFFTGKNIGVFFRTDIRTLLKNGGYENFVKVAKLLKKYVSEKTIENIIKNNVFFLFQNPEVIQKKIDSFIATYGENSKEFSEKIDSMINDKYSIQLKNNSISTGKKTKQEKGERIDNGQNKVDVEFIITFEPRKVAPITDNEKYLYIHNEINSVVNLCEICARDTAKELAEWNIENTGELANVLAKPFVNYKGNTTFKANILHTLKKISKMINSIELQDLKDCIRVEINNAIKYLANIVNGQMQNGHSLMERIEFLEEDTTESFLQERRRTKTFDANKYKPAIEKYQTMIDELSLIQKSLKRTDTRSLDLLKEEKKQTQESYENLIASYAKYKKDREDTRELEAVIAELKEAVVGFDFVRMYFEDISQKLADSVKVEMKPVESDVLPATKTVDRKEELLQELAQLKSKVGKKVFDALEGNCKGKAFKKVSHNLGINPSQEMYADMVALAECLKQLDILENSTENLSSK